MAITAPEDKGIDYITGSGKGLCKTLQIGYYN